MMTKFSVTGPLHNMANTTVNWVETTLQKLSYVC
jgi:hypothetical protein